MNASSSTPPPQPTSKKRKRGPANSESPAPDPAAPPVPEVLSSSRADLSSRPQLSISRGPFFLPAVEGSQYFKTDLTGLNRIGFRYSPAGINPPGHTLPCRTIESNPTAFRISWEDRSSFVSVTKDGLGLLGGKGFRSARCNAPIREGRWYMEVKIGQGGGEHVQDDGKREGAHVRVGFGRREAPLNGPVGLDGYSYGYRDKTGDKVTISRPRPYGRPFSTGDVIGMYICLPPRRQADPEDRHDPARLKRERIAIDLKGQEVFEAIEYPQSKEMIALMDYSAKSSTSASIPSASKKATSGKLPERGPRNAPKNTAPNLRPLPTLPNSHIAFFLNGECQGVAFEELYDYLQLRQTASSRKGKERKRGREGVKEHTDNPFDDGTLGYYPFISLFNEASVQLNPGPDFAFPPPANIDKLLFPDRPESDNQRWRPCSERYPEFMKEQWELDALEEEDAVEDFQRVLAAEKVAADKKAQRDKKRQQAEARKRAKLAAQDGSPSAEDKPPSPMPTSGPGQPSPLRGIAFSPDKMDVDEVSLKDVSYNPSPLRHNTLSEVHDDEPQSREETPTRQPTPVSYGGGFKREDFRFETATLSGPGQPGGSAWTHSVDEPLPRPPRLLAGPGQSGLAALLNSDESEMPPFVEHRPAY